MAKKPIAKKSVDPHAAPAGFVFRGTVQRARASTVPGVKPAANTAIVRVDDVVAAPAALAHAAGREVTVVAGNGIAPFIKGQRAVFHTSSLSFGSEIAVRATRVEALGIVSPAVGMTAARAAAAPLAAAPGGVVDPVQAHHDLRLKHSLDRADVIVTGTVSDVRMAPETRAQALAAPAAPPPARISEHDPIWHEAVVNVDSVEKGKTTRRQVVVRFPSSNDVRWKDHPKLRPGQQGIFLLSATAASGVAPFTTAASPSPGGPAMNAVGEPQPMSAIGKVRQLLQAPSETPRATQTQRRRRRARPSRTR